MITPALARGTPATAPRDDLRPALTAIRARLGLVALLLVLAVGAWWSTAARMSGMDGGPGTDLGGLGWFVGVWIVMMAAMMLPSLAPTVALYARMTRRRGADRALLFTSGYLLVWGAAGALSYGVFEVGKAALGAQLAWHAAGRPFAAAVLALVALYELTPLKDVCLGKCRSPVGFLLGRWRDGRLGALEMGSAHACWCVGCCWALMAALFALGIMSLAWMAFVAALIALEKTLPWRWIATRGTAVVLAALAIAVLLAPGSVPALTIPAGAPAGMHAMN
jgi:predicted metal-binding membrane protein